VIVDDKGRTLDIVPKTAAPAKAAAAAPAPAATSAAP
jgi:hypothetical protein